MSQTNQFRTRQAIATNGDGAGKVATFTASSTADDATLSWSQSLIRQSFCQSHYRPHLLRKLPKSHDPQSHSPLSRPLSFLSIHPYSPYPLFLYPLFLSPPSSRPVVPDPSPSIFIVEGEGSGTEGRLPVSW